MHQILQGKPGVPCILGNVIVTRKPKRNLDSVLLGLKANIEKCEFLTDSVKYIEHDVTKEGI